jgi:hypothetical protein
LIVSEDAAVVVVFILYAIWYAVISYYREQRDKRQDHGRVLLPRNLVPPAPNSTYLGLRNRVLAGSAAKLALPATLPSISKAVLMDLGVENGTATVVAFEDGTASIYLSSGGGFLGGGQGYEAIRNAGRHMLEVGRELQRSMHKTTEYPLPSSGAVSFYAVTNSGVFTASVSELDCKKGRSPFAKLYFADRTSSPNTGSSHQSNEEKGQFAVFCF